MFGEMFQEAQGGFIKAILAYAMKDTVDGSQLS